MSFLRLARNCGVFAKSFAPLVSDVRSASASIANRIDVLPSANKNIRTFSLSALRYCEAQADEDDAEETPKKKLKYDKPNRDRSIRHPVETSIEYMQSNAYETTYGNRLVWEGYRRVHKGGTAPRKTRKSCIRFGVVTTASPCPICRDEYLVFAHQNLALLKQFISPYTGEVEPYGRTGICQKQHRNLLGALERAYDLGLITYEVPFRKYDYSDYYDFYDKTNN